jgi:hypothetical protein
MQKKRFLKKNALLFIFFALTVVQGSSSYYDYDYDYPDYQAIYMKRADLERSISYVPPSTSSTDSPIKNPGKIYYKHPNLFVNEKYKGVHLFDNTDPSKPLYKGFIAAPGCLDMAVKNNIIYLDNAVDMVSVDLNNLNDKNMMVTKRLPDIFPQLAPPDGSSQLHPEGLIIVEWIKRKND